MEKDFFTICECWSTIFAFKRIVILTYVIWGCCKWFMPLLGYSEDTSLYYLFNEIQKIKYGNILLIVICVVMIIILVSRLYG